MDKVLYNLMDWAAIEEITYSESANPHSILGARKVDEGILVQVFIPDALQVEVVTKDKRKQEMSLVDDTGFFATLFEDNGKEFKYTLNITNLDKTKYTTSDPYSFKPQISEEDLEKFSKGIHYEIYEKLGAHKKKIDGVEGVYFAVWAPCAMRVSVVGDFNNWDGRKHQMRKLSDSGVFEIFIPKVCEGDLYKFEVKTSRGEPMLKSDPYGVFSQVRPDNASIVYDLSGFEWSDKKWLSERAKTQKTGDRSAPMNIYEVHLGSWKRKECLKDENDNEIYGSEFYNYRELAVELAEYIKEMNYTHIELMPIMEHPLDESWGYQVTGYYSPTSRYGTPKDLMYFIDYMHSKGIGVIFDWVPAHFPRDLHGLGVFDGSHVYEHADPRQGTHPHWGTYIYNYGRPQVSNFLIANALYWAKLFHADGIRMDAVASMLYLDYGKNAGEWVANKYGGHENLEAVEFLKHLNSVFKKEFPSAILIAEESTAWPKISGDLENGGIGFDYKWNMGWMNDFLRYMSNEPQYRSYHYGELTFSMLYQYSEKFILVFSHDEVVHGKGTLATKMGVATQEEKFENLRAAYGYMIAHPGKKLLFMSQEFGQIDEWNEKKQIEWELLKYDIHSKLQGYVRALNTFYLAHPALWEQDNVKDGFEWMNCYSYQENIVAFVRKSYKDDEMLLVVCNFSNTGFYKFDIDVPFHGKYKEIFNSDLIEFGGKGVRNPRVKISKPTAIEKKTTKKANSKSKSEEVNENIEKTDEKFGKELDEKLNEKITISIPETGILVFSITKI